VALNIYGVAIHDLQGSPLNLGEFQDRAVLVVNVASKCGLTPQYNGLEALQKQYVDRGFTVLGVPCNQRHPLELREVPGGAGRSGHRAVLAAGQARRPGSRRGRGVGAHAVRPPSSGTITPFR
jgi:hypothetical protein